MAKKGEVKVWDYSYKLHKFSVVSLQQFQSAHLLIRILGIYYESYENKAFKLTDAIRDPHECSCIVRAQIQRIDFHSWTNHSKVLHFSWKLFILTRIISAHKAHRDCEQCHRQIAIASSKRSSHKENSGKCEGKRCIKLSGSCQSNKLLLYAPIAEHAKAHCANPHSLKFGGEMSWK